MGIADECTCMKVTTNCSIEYNTHHLGAGIKDISDGPITVAKTLASIKGARIIPGVVVLGIHVYKDQLGRQCHMHQDQSQWHKSKQHMTQRFAPPCLAELQGVNISEGTGMPDGLTPFSVAPFICLTKATLLPSTERQ